MKKITNCDQHQDHAKQSPVLIQAAHEILEHMSTNLTLSQAKSALVRQLVKEQEICNAEQQLGPGKQAESYFCCR